MGIVFSQCPTGKVETLNKKKHKVQSTEIFVEMANKKKYQVRSTGNIYHRDSRSPKVPHQQLLQHLLFVYTATEAGKGLKKISLCFAEGDLEWVKILTLVYKEGQSVR